MIQRKIMPRLEYWAHHKSRKPLVIRGARQVGKTTLVRQFSSEFEQYIYLNLEMPADRAPFEEFTDMESLLEAIFFLKNKKISRRAQTLIFLDEIQEAPEAVALLRYFYEQAPDIPVIAAGSLLESLFDPDINFPVGRVEYKILRPVCFEEFLEAIGEESALEQFRQIPVAPFAHQRLLQLFHTYAILGGMPEIVQHYISHGDLTALKPIYASLITSYMEDVEKYARHPSQVQTIRHVIKTCFGEAGKRISFRGFGKSDYGSREMGEALRILEKALLLRLVYPSTHTTLPLLPDQAKSPRLHLLDTGLMNYKLGIQKQIIGTNDLHSIYQGVMIEHLVGQELLSGQFEALSDLHFWVREKTGSMAEIDYVYPYDGRLIPIEVKSGAGGKLRSLHQFMDQSPHKMALRFFNGQPTRTQVKTLTGKTYHLLSLPYYLASQTEAYIRWFQEQLRMK